MAGDAQLEALRNDWEDRVVNQAEKQSDDQLATILYEVLKHSEKLKDDMHRWRRYEKGHKKKTYQFLLTAWQRQIDEDRRDANARLLQRRGPAAPAKTHICRGWLKNGVCKTPDCKYDHPADAKGAKAKSAAAPEKDNGKGRSASRGKGTGKGKARSRSPSPASLDTSKKLCHFFAAGTCKKGKDCPYLHDNKSKKPASERGGKPCTSFFKNGSCSYGEKCVFSHNKEKADKAPAAPAAKSSAKSDKAARKAAAKAAKAAAEATK